MKANNRILMLALALGWGLACLFPTHVEAQTRVEPGFNLMSEEQDVEIGRQAATEIERELPLLNDRSVSAYVDALGQALARQAPHAHYPYEFKVLNLADVNAFALPGGFIYVNRGLLEAVDSEAQLAGVLSHEIAHVALRHGTNQASKAYLASTGLGVLGELLGEGTTRDIVGAAGGFGLNAAFLKFGRDDEEEADIIGAQILARAGYDPMAMVEMFAALQARQQRDPSAVEAFFSSHPRYADRQANVRHEASMLQVAAASPVGGFAAVQRELAALDPAVTQEQLANTDRRPIYGDEDDGADPVDVPSNHYLQFDQRDGYFSVRHPQDWLALASNGFDVTFAPRDGIIEEHGRREIVYGVVINHFEMSHRGNSYTRDRALGFAQVIDPIRLEAPRSLERATLEVVDEILQSNPYLDVERRPAETRAVDGEPAVALWLSGRNPKTGAREKVTLITREAGGDEHLVYMLLIAPEDDYERLQPAFARMVSSLRVNDHVAHGQ